MITHEWLEKIFKRAVHIKMDLPYAKGAGGGGWGATLGAGSRGVMKAAGGM